jgi:hypothetical protein
MSLWAQLLEAPAARRSVTVHRATIAAPRHSVIAATHLQSIAPETIPAIA